APLRSTRAERAHGLVMGVTPWAPSPKTGPHRGAPGFLEASVSAFIPCSFRHGLDRGYFLPWVGPAKPHPYPTTLACPARQLTNMSTGEKLPSSRIGVVISTRRSVFVSV